MVWITSRDTSIDSSQITGPIVRSGPSPRHTEHLAHVRTSQAATDIHSLCRALSPFAIKSVLGHRRRRFSGPGVEVPSARLVPVVRFSLPQLASYTAATGIRTRTDLLASPLALVNVQSVPALGSHRVDLKCGLPQNDCLYGRADTGKLFLAELLARIRD